MTQSKGPVLETRDLTAFYGDFQALFGISFILNEGETVAIIGANGAGKSTFLKSISGLLPRPPSAVRLDGRDIGALPAYDVVKLGIADEAALRQAVAEITEAVARIEPPPSVRGISVQPMISAGTELVIGARLDPQFGPLIVVGMGGILVELLADTAADLAPVDHNQAMAMLKSLKAWKLLEGYRGARGVDIARIAEIVVAVSELATDLSASIAEIDLNPVICSPDRITAVDALIIRRGAG